MWKAGWRQQKSATLVDVSVALTADFTANVIGVETTVNTAPKDSESITLVIN